VQSSGCRPGIDILLSLSLLENCKRHILLGYREEGKVKNADTVFINVDTQSIHTARFPVHVCLCAPASKLSSKMVPILILVCLTISGDRNVHLSMRACQRVFRERCRTTALWDMPADLHKIVMGSLIMRDTWPLRLASKQLRLVANAGLSSLIFKPKGFTCEVHAKFSQALLSRLNALWNDTDSSAMVLPKEGRPLESWRKVQLTLSILLEADTAPLVTRVVLQAHTNGDYPRFFPTVEQFIVALPGLLSLSLPYLDVKTLDLLPRLSRLTHLDFSKPISRKFVPQLLQLTTLKSLRLPDFLPNCEDGSSNSRPWEALVTMIGRGGFAQLTSLEVSCDFCAPPVLGQLTFLSRLKCHMIGGESGPFKWQPLTALVCLRELQLVDRIVSNDLEYHWRRYGSVANDPADARDWHHVSALTALTSLHLELSAFRRDCSLVCHLTTLTNLRRLWLGILQGSLVNQGGDVRVEGPAAVLGVLTAARELESVTLTVRSLPWSKLDRSLQTAVGAALGNLPHLTQLEFNFRRFRYEAEEGWMMPWAAIDGRPLLAGLSCLPAPPHHRLDPRGAADVPEGAQAGPSFPVPTVEGAAAPQFLSGRVPWGSPWVPCSGSYGGSPRLQALSISGVGHVLGGVVLKQIAQLTSLRCLSLDLEMRRPLTLSEVTRAKPFPIGRNTGGIHTKSGASISESHVQTSIVQCSSPE
jgi:hypothetical protein